MEVRRGCCFHRVHDVRDWWNILPSYWIWARWRCCGGRRRM